jgi:protein TonB
MERHHTRTLQKLALLFLIGVFAPLSISAQRIVPATSDSAPLKDAISMKVVLHQVPPAYPLEARRSHLSGRGILVGQVDSKTGFVTSVRMEKSTGHKILDDAALEAFRQWRFKSGTGTIRKFRTPITYNMLN